jgi:uncharacterized protein YqfB (UPF0267 family)
MSVKSEATNITLGQRTLKSIEHIRKEAITWKKTSGFFVSGEKLNKLEDAVTNLMETGVESSVGPSAQIEMMAEINKLRTMNDRAEAALKAANALAASRAKDAEKMEESLDAMKKMAAEEVNEVNLEAGNIKLQLDAYKLRVKDLTQQVKNSSLSDPSDLVTMKSDLDKSRAEVTQCNNELQKLNAIKAGHAKRIQEYERNLAQVKADLEANRIRAESLEDDKKRALLRTDLRLKENTHVVVSQDLSKFLGQKAADWFKQALSPAADTREKAYTLMLTIKKSSNKRVSFLGKLIQKVFDLVRNLSSRARKVLDPWLDILIADINSMQIRAIGVYRRQLEDIISEHKLITLAKKVASDEKAKEKGDTPPMGDYKPSFWEEILIWGELLLVRRPKRYSRSLGHKILNTLRVATGHLRKGWNMVLGFFQTSTNPSSSYEEYDVPDEGPIIFDFDESKPIGGEDSGTVYES